MDGLKCVISPVLTRIYLLFQLFVFCFFFGGGRSCALVMFQWFRSQNNASKFFNSQLLRIPLASSPLQQLTLK